LVHKLVMFASSNLKKLKINNVDVLESDGISELEEELFDKIIVSAATGEIPSSWVEHLKEGGVIVLPKGDMYLQTLMKYKKENGKLVLLEESIPVMFVPLRGENGIH
jgi:protein-L-isoaspartate(D-aspartate) O-methyltransferase